MNPVDRARFFAAYRERYGRLNQAQVDGLGFLLGSLEVDADVQDPRWAAYMLATVKHETGDAFRPVYEKGPRTYFDRYEPTTERGRALGNVHPGDGYLYRGRGDVQITGLDNYRRMSRELGLAGEDDLVLHPDRALDPSIAYRILSLGMRKGRFTGRRLADYILGEHCDLVNARRIINGIDRAERIAAYATVFQAAIGG